jgi:hypothetical protein
MTNTESKKDTDAQTTAPDFIAFVAALDKGRTATELGQKLQELTAAVENTGRGGTLTLKVTVKPAGTRTTKSGAMLVADEITLKAPKMPRDESIFFSDADHNLVRNDPNQTEMF